mgnify:CR=1 FL=1
MAKKKIVPEEMEQEVEMIEEVKVEKKNEEKPQVVSSKEKICEFYGIQDAELLSPERDLSKYWLSKQEEEVLIKWAEENLKTKAKEVTFVIYNLPEEVRVIVEKYGVTPYQVACEELGELSKEEKKIILDYFKEV